MGCASSTETQVKPQPQPQLDYEALDRHARQAPESTRNSVEDIHQYLSSASTSDVAMVRLIYVWITEFIGHTSGDSEADKQLDGPQGVDRVLTTKTADSTGYVKLFETLCSRANIQVQNIQGFAKGGSHSPDDPYTVQTPPNHAWNAVRLAGQWYLVDCAWGAGHVQRDGRYKRHFDEFYFKTDPKQLIVTHFPFIDENLESSKRWQLLKKPITLDEFNKRLTPYPEAFKFRVEPFTHQDSVIEIRGEDKIVFKVGEGFSMLFMSSLWLIEDNTLVEQSNQTFDTIYMKEYSIRVRPNCIGTYYLRVFGGKNEEVGKAVEDLPLLFRYIVKCIEVIDNDFEYPEVSEKALTNQCMLLEPLTGKLTRGSQVHVHIKSNQLDELMVNGKVIKGDSGEFKGTVELDTEESTLTIYGSKENSDKYIPLYGFEMIKES